MLLIHGDINQCCLNLLSPFHVLLCKLYSILGVVLKLYSALVLVEVLSVAKRACYLVVSLFLPTARVTLYLRSVSYRLANNLDPSVATLAEQTHLSFTKEFGTLLFWMAGCLALMWAV